MNNLTIASYNVNGIRAALKKGLIEWIKEVGPDVICFQETKAQPEQIEDQLFQELGYHCYWFSAIKKGYSGVGIISKIEADHIETGIGDDRFDSEGRNIRIDIGDLSIMSAYYPSGTTGGPRQAFKYEYLDYIYDYLQQLKKERPKLIVSGDYNVAHLDIDIHNPKKQNKTSGFLPEERAWMSKLFDSDFLDVYRKFNKEPHNYSWWSYRAAARKNNKGWRIDYHAATKALEIQLVAAEIRPDAMHSDHCPVMMELSRT